MLVTIGLTIAFKKSDNLAAAYGIAVSVTMLMTTVLLFIAIREILRWNLLTSCIVAGALFVIDSAFFLANIVKIEDGGYVPLLLATVVYAVMYIWHRGISEIFKRVAENPVSIETFMAKLTKDRIMRPPGTAVFLTRSLKDTPPVIAWYVEHSRALQERVVAITVETTSTPRVTERDRFSIVEVAPGFWRAVVHYGFMERPDVSRLLREFSAKSCMIDLSEITYYVGLETIIAREDSDGLPRWLVVLFAAIYRNAAHVTDDYKFPRDHVLEIGRQVTI
jgi:KUP system potassium uptake protein